MNLLDKARAIIAAGKVATPGPWTAGRDGVYGDDGTYLADTGHADGLDEAKVNTAFIAAARDADQIAARLIEAERVIRMLQDAYSCDGSPDRVPYQKYTGAQTNETWWKAEDFLASLSQDDAQDAAGGEGQP